jgi:hypothetical protein
MSSAIHGRGTSKLAAKYSCAQCRFALDDLRNADG